MRKPIVFFMLLMLFLLPVSDAFAREVKGNEITFDMDGTDVNRDGTELSFRVVIGNHTPSVLPVCDVNILFPLEGISVLSTGQRVVNEYSIVLQNEGVSNDELNQSGVSARDGQRFLIRALLLQPGEERRYNFGGSTQRSGASAAGGKLSAYMDVSIDVTGENGGVLIPEYTFTKEIPFYIPLSPPPTEPETIQEREEELPPSLEISLISTAWHVHADAPQPAEDAAAGLQPDKDFILGGKVPAGSAGMIDPESVFVSGGDWKLLMAWLCPVFVAAVAGLHLITAILGKHRSRKEAKLLHFDRKK